MVAAQTPTLARIKNEVSLDDARALLSIAVCEVCDFFNVGKNMNNTQIALTVDLIIERFWYFKLEEIKYCFRRAMMREKLFDRLDGNIIISWLREYDAERTDEAMRLSDQDEAIRLNQSPDDPNAITLQQHIANLRQCAGTDKKAASQLAQISTVMNAPVSPTREQQLAKKHEFETWKTFNYLITKNK